MITMKTINASDLAQRDAFFTSWTSVPVKPTSVLRKLSAKLSAQSKRAAIRQSKITP